MLQLWRLWHCQRPFRARWVELMSVCVYVVRPSHCHLPVSLSYLSICHLFILSPFSRFTAFFFQLCESSASFSLFLALMFSSSLENLPIHLSTCLSVSLVLVFSSPSALVVFSIPLQRSVDCDDGSGRESAHWLFLLGNVKVCKPACKCQHECVSLSGFRRPGSWCHGCVYMCVWCTVWPVLLAAGLALWLQSLGDHGVEVWGWMVPSITSLSATTADTVDGGKKEPLDLTICEAATVSVGACLILCMVLTSPSTSACKASMKTCLFACWRQHCCQKES